MSDPCLEDLAYASYGGVGFWVETDDGKYGRRIVSHEYPMRDTPFHEDLGEAVNTWSVKAYVYGASATAQKDALVAVCRQRGAQMLVLPAETPFMAVCPQVSHQRAKDRLGWFEITMEFKRDGGASAGPTPIVIFERVLNALTQGVGAAFGAAFGELMVTTGALGFVGANAVGRVLVLGDTLMSLVQQGPVDTTIAAGLIADIDGLTSAAPTLLQPPPDQVAGVFCSDPSFVKPDVPYYAPENAFRDSGAGLALALTVGDLVRRTCDNMAASDALSAARGLTTFSVAEYPAISESISDKADAVNAAMFCSLVRVNAWLQYARAATQAPFATRALAVTARANLVVALDAEIENLGTNGEVIAAVAEVRDQGAKMLSAMIATTSAIVTVYAPNSMPALYWAYRLYSDPSRAQDLVDYNDVENPAFMPMTFSAKAG